MRKIKVDVVPPVNQAHHPIVVIPIDRRKETRALWYGFMTVDLLLANAIVCLAGYVQASVGIGFAMIAVPLLALIELAYVPGPSLFVMLFLSLTMALTAWQDVDKRGLTALIPGLLAGTIVGTLFLGLLPPSVFGLVFGSLVLIALIVGQVGFEPVKSNLTFGFGGFVAGLMGTISGIHGAPLTVIYQHAKPITARATIALIFIIGSCLSLLSLHASGLFGRPEMLAGLALLPGLVIGFLLARVSHHLLTDRMARGMMIALAGTSALILIAKSLF
jgi:uncharacterized membrane protein YfcA